MRRRCGWIADASKGEANTLVWARGGVALTCCPKPAVTPESEALVEEFLVRRRLGGMDFESLSARQVEAFLILEQALAAELSDGEHNTRPNLSKLS